jgi:hypothetical protein
VGTARVGSVSTSTAREKRPSNDAIEITKQQVIRGTHSREITVSAVDEASTHGKWTCDRS